ncbi:MAG: metalloregulator ArsR/SmtB family transcription factor [Pseudomonadota bacterium]
MFNVILSASPKASRLFKALSNERRLNVLCHLSEKEYSVNDLCKMVDLSQSALSQHLAMLRAYGLVKTRRDAQTIYYSVSAPEIAVILNTLQKYYVSQGDDEHILPGTTPLEAEAAKDLGAKDIDDSALAGR